MCAAVFSLPLAKANHPRRRYNSARDYGTRIRLRDVRTYVRRCATSERKREEDRANSPAATQLISRQIYRGDQTNRSGRGLRARFFNSPHGRSVTLGRTRIERRTRSLAELAKYCVYEARPREDAVILRACLRQGEGPT